MAKITIGFLIGCIMCSLFAWAYVNGTQESITDLEQRIRERDSEIAGLIAEAESIAENMLHKSTISERELQQLRDSLQESDAIIRTIREQHQSVEQHNSEAQEGAGRLYELTDRLRKIAGEIPESNKDLAECSDPVSDR